MEQNQDTNEAQSGMSINIPLSAVITPETSKLFLTKSELQMLRPIVSIELDGYYGEVAALKEDISNMKKSVKNKEDLYTNTYYGYLCRELVRTEGRIKQLNAVIADIKAGFKRINRTGINAATMTMATAQSLRHLLRFNLMFDLESSDIYDHERKQFMENSNKEDPATAEKHRMAMRFGDIRDKLKDRFNRFSKVQGKLRRQIVMAGNHNDPLHMSADNVATAVSNDGSYAFLSVNHCDEPGKITVHAFDEKNIRWTFVTTTHTTQPE